MKFKSQIVTAASGSIGGTTFAHNQGGLYMRARSIPTNPQSAFQTAVRNAVNTLASAWASDLSEAQREAWATYAANVPVVDVFGDARNLSGQQHYVRSNVPRLQAELDRVDDAPTVFNLGPNGATLNTTANSGSENVQINFDDEDDWVDDPQSALLVYISRPQSAGRTFFKGPYRLAEAVVGDDTSPPSTPATVESPFPFNSGDAVFAQMRITRADGRLSGISRGRAIAAGT